MGYIFFIDHLLYSKIDGFISTLIFPLAYTSFDFLLNLFNPFGTTGILGYTQLEFLSFSQLTSITGMWGLTFMITWFGSVFNWVFNNYSNTKSVKKGISIYLSILITILIYGGVRLNIPLQNGTVKISGIHAHDKNIEGYKMWKSLNKQDTVMFRKINNRIIDDLIEKTKVEADAGAKVIIWSEISFVLLKSEEDSINKVIKRLAVQKGIYLLASPYIISKDSKPENKIVLYSPSGELVLTHYKYGGSFLEGSVEGIKKLKQLKLHLAIYLP